MLSLCMQATDVTAVARRVYHDDHEHHQELKKVGCSKRCPSHMAIAKSHPPTSAARNSTRICDVLSRASQRQTSLALRQGAHWRYVRRVLARNDSLETRSPRIECLALLSIVAVLVVDLAGDRAAADTDVVEHQGDSVGVDAHLRHARGGGAAEVVNAEIANADRCSSAPESLRGSVGINPTFAIRTWEEPAIGAGDVTCLTDELQG
jgi:hypothetical protein